MVSSPTEPREIAESLAALEQVLDEGAAPNFLDVKALSYERLRLAQKLDTFLREVIAKKSIATTLINDEGNKSMFAGELIKVLDYNCSPNSAYDSGVNCAKNSSKRVN